jgi:protein tyrosine/serine phosphatase
MRLVYKRVMRIAAISLLSVGAYLGMLQVFGNFHSVVDGEVYRSAQVEQGDIAEYQHKYGIRSVLNLRGKNAGSSWYDDEVKEAQALGVKHIDFRMSTSKELTDKQAIELIQIMRDAPKPMLIHCRAGADRTGLASAIYVAAIAKGTEWQAERQMWLHYGHYPFGATKAMNRTFERLEPVFGYQGS